MEIVLKGQILNEIIQYNISMCLHDHVQSFYKHFVYQMYSQYRSFIVRTISIWMYQ